MALLAETRLLTLTGAGGCGKTRLAQRIAGRVLHRYEGGVWWTELASLADEGLIADAVAAVLGVRVPPGRDAVDALAGYLRTAPALVVIDNCEHLIAGAAAFVHRLLRSTPGTAILATSREPLAVEGEVTWRVPSLSLPPAACETPEAVGHYDAVRLFIERAVQADPDFRVSNENAPAVAQICQRLDGIPLALELAAARVRSLTPERIAAALDDRFRLLAAHRRGVVPRQKTLLASVDWSHELLGPEERVLFRRLGIFARGFTLDAADLVRPAPSIRYPTAPLWMCWPAWSTSRWSTWTTQGATGCSRRSASTHSTGWPTRVRQRSCRTATWLGLATWQGRWRARRPTPTQPRWTSWRRSTPTSVRRWIGRRLPAGMTGPWRSWGHWPSSGPSTGTTARRRTGSHDWLSRPGATGGQAVARARWGCAYVRFYGGDAVGAYERAQIGLAEANAAGDSSTAARCLHTMGAGLYPADPVLARQHLVQAAELARTAQDRVVPGRRAAVRRLHPPGRG